LFEPFHEALLLYYFCPYVIFAPQHGVLLLLEYKKSLPVSRFALAARCACLKRLLIRTTRAKASDHRGALDFQFYNYLFCTPCCLLLKCSCWCFCSLFLNRRLSFVRLGSTSKKIRQFGNDCLLFIDGDVEDV
jgi:hypothetical protein